MVEHDWLSFFEMKFLAVLPLLTLVRAFMPQSNTNGSIQLPETRRDSAEAPIPSPTAQEAFPRLVMYVQTFTTPEKQPLSLLLLLKYETKVTHVVLASVHLHEEPGVIRLNNDPFEAPTWNVIWEEAKDPPGEWHQSYGVARWCSCGHLFEIEWH